MRSRFRARRRAFLAGVRCAGGPPGLSLPPWALMQTEQYKFCPSDNVCDNTGGDDPLGSDCDAPPGDVCDKPGDGPGADEGRDDGAGLSDNACDYTSGDDFPGCVHGDSVINPSKLNIARAPTMSMTEFLDICAVVKRNLPARAAPVPMPLSICDRPAPECEPELVHLLDTYSKEWYRRHGGRRLMIRAWDVWDVQTQLRREGYDEPATSSERMARSRSGAYSGGRG